MPTPNPDLSRFEDLYCDLAPEPELQEFGRLAKLIAAHAERYRLEDQAFILARLVIIAAHHMGRDHQAFWAALQEQHAELLTMLEHGNESGVKH